MKDNEKAFVVKDSDGKPIDALIIEKALQEDYNKSMHWVDFEVRYDKTFPEIVIIGWQDRPSLILREFHIKRALEKYVEKEKINIKLGKVEKVRHPIKEPFCNRYGG